MVKIIDEMVSLRAWEMTDESVKKEIRQLLQDDRKAVESFVKMHKGMQEYVKNGYTSAQKINMSKNYMRETYDNRFSTILAPARDEIEMKRKGYKLVKIVDTVGGGRSGKSAVGLYVSTDMVKQPFNKSALRVIGHGQDGIPMMQMEYFAQNANAYKTVKEDVKFL